MPPKRDKIRNARTIRTELVNDKRTSGDVSDGGALLQVDRFLKSREFELRALRSSMQRSRNSGSTRVFQALPRKMRRRTASHNVRRIPKRLRKRAIREMIGSSENNQVQSSRNFGPRTSGRTHLTSQQLYRLKMSVRLLRLAARSRALRLDTPSNVSLRQGRLRQRIKTLEASQLHRTYQLNNRMGARDYCEINKLAEFPPSRPKYGKRQREFVWLPSHVWHAKRSHMIKRWSYQFALEPTQKCYRLVHRMGSHAATSDGALCMDTSYFGTMVIKGDAKLLVELISKLTASRACKEKYYNLKYWFEGLGYELSDKTSIKGPLELLWVDTETVLLRLHPAIYSSTLRSITKNFKSLQVQDCRFALGSVSVRGAKALNSLSAILRTPRPSKSFTYFQKLSTINDENALPKNCMFAFETIDPRHVCRPKPIVHQKPSTRDILEFQATSLTEDIHNVLEKLVNSDTRIKSYENKNTLKMLARRKVQLLASPNSSLNIIPYDDTDPSVPILVIRRPKNGDWLVMLPWFWLLPFWYQLLKVPRLYHIGTRQERQLAYTENRLYFPDDYPFTEVGYLEHSRIKRDDLKKAWERKPLSKRNNYDKIPALHKVDIPNVTGEIGDPFCCDWNLLRILRNGYEHLSNKGKPHLFDKDRTSQFKNNQRCVNTIYDLFELYRDCNGSVFSKTPLLYSKLSRKCESFVVPDRSNASQEICNSPRFVTPVTCEMIGRGHPADNARIYAIAGKEIEVYRETQNRKYKANGKLDHENKLPLPNVTDLVGFVTAGNFSLRDGKGRATAMIDTHFAQNTSHHLFLIRNVGTNVYRLAKWQEIAI